VGKLKVAIDGFSVQFSILNFFGGMFRFYKFVLSV
jgi:hypothetical protein